MIRQVALLIGGQLAGIVSERDYARKVILKGRSSHETKVREIMTTPALFVTPEKTVAEAMLPALAAAVSAVGRGG